MRSLLRPGRSAAALIKKGDTVCLGGLFRNEDLFKSAAVTMYGESTKVQYLYRNLLWGQKLYKKLRFVLVRYKGTQSILVSTDLKLDPVTIIALYASRFGELKQQIDNTRPFSQDMPGHKIAVDPS